MRVRILIAASVALAVVPPDQRAVAGHLRTSLNAAKEPQNYLTGWRRLLQHFATLTQITPANVKNLNLEWVYQAAVTGSWQPTPLVVDGIMYLTQRPNDVIALDATTGRVFWTYRHTNEAVIACCGSNNRGVAILGELLYMGTLDGHLVAIEARSGREAWKTRVADSKQGYSITVSPLALKDRVVIGVGAANTASAASSPHTTLRQARAVAVLHHSGPGEPGHETWEACPPNPKTYCDPEAWKHGGASIWVTGSFDPDLNLTYWGTGNAGPDYNADQRPGDNLYTASVVALDADTGMRFVGTISSRRTITTTTTRFRSPCWRISRGRPPQRGCRVGAPAGAPVKAMLWANRNGNFYVLDRVTGKLYAKPFVKVNWMNGFDATGRPIQTKQPADLPTYPGIQGGTSTRRRLRPRTKLMYVSTWSSTRTSSAARRSSMRPDVSSPGAAIKRSSRHRASRHATSRARQASAESARPQSITGPTQPATVPFRPSIR